MPATVLLAQHSLAFPWGRNTSEVVSQWLLFLSQESLIPIMQNSQKAIRLFKNEVTKVLRSILSTKPCLAHCQQDNSSKNDTGCAQSFPPLFFREKAGAHKGSNQDTALS